MKCNGNNWEMALGDCRDVLAAMTLGADSLVIGDPPYGVSERTDRKAKGRSKLAECNDFAPVIDDDKPFDPAPFLGLPRVVLWGANHFGSRLPDASCWLAWDKRDGISSNDNADCELAWTNLPGPARLFTHRWNGMIKASEKDQRRLHPTQKPVALMRWIIERWSKPGDLIIEPYAGSAPAGVAALQTGRRYLGVELSPDYFNTACERLRAEQEGSTLIAQRAGQIAMFGK